MTGTTDHPLLALDQSVRSFRDGTVLVGGHPGRLIVLTPAGVDTLAAWLEGSRPAGADIGLARRLVVAGMAHPLTPTIPEGGDLGAGSHPDVTLVVPARDRPRSLERCLTSLGTQVPVVVVDDGSVDAAAVADVCDRHGATLVRRSQNGGPGAARNMALASVATDLVAFVDSDCEVTEGWLAGLTWLLADPEVAVVAPRVRPRRTGEHAEGSVLGRYSAHRSALDLGPEPGEVGPGRIVGYVPTTAVVGRVAALRAIGGFDESMRVGEDVDLVWRLIEDGWRVRYQPTVTVFHDEPGTWAGLLRRRLRYGTSAAPLARRHPGRLAPLELRAWPAGVSIALLARRPVAALALLAGSTWSLDRQLRRFGVPRSMSLRWSAQGVTSTGIGLGHALTVLGTPLLIAGAVRSRKWAAPCTALLVAPPLVEWWHKRPAVDPVRWCLSAVADDVAYGVGVWWGCFRARTLGPLLPKVRLRTSGAVPADKVEAVRATPMVAGGMGE